VDTIVHLGHVIRSDMDGSGDIENQRCKCIGQTNNVLCYFGKPVSDVKYRRLYEKSETTEEVCRLCANNTCKD